VYGLGNGNLLDAPIEKNDQMKRRVSTIDQVKGYVSKIDQLQCIRIAVDRFFKLSRSFYRFFKGVFLLDRLLIGGIALVFLRCSLFHCCCGSFRP